MLLVPNVRITIGNKLLKHVTSVKVETSAKVLADIATIEIPTTAKLKRKGELITETPTNVIFAVGDQVKIELGYNGKLNTEFEGFIKKIKTTTPLSIECEDATFLLRRKTLNESWKTVTLKEVLNKIIEGTGVTLATKYLPSVTFHGFYLRNVNAAQALQKLKEDFGFTIYFSSFKVLFCGLSYDTEDEKTIKYIINRNTIDDDLEPIDSSDVKMKVKAISVLPNNERIEIEVGDGATADAKDKSRKEADRTAQFVATESDVESRVVHFYNVRTKKEIQALALEELRKFKKTGLKGGFNTFLIPFAKVGNTAKMIDEVYPERGDGNYLIDKVTTTLDENGGRRSIELGLRV